MGWEEAYYEMCIMKSTLPVNHQDQTHKLFMRSSFLMLVIYLAEQCNHGFWQPGTSESDLFEYMN